MHRILRHELNLFPYRLQVKSALSVGDKEEQVLFCQAALAKLDLDPHWFNDIWWTDETHFLLSGHVNKKDMVFWGEKQKPTTGRLPSLIQRRSPYGVQ